MSQPSPRSVASIGLPKWLKEQGIDPVEFEAYVDKGVRPASLVKIYGKARDTILKYLRQLAADRGYDDYHKLYK